MEKKTTGNKKMENTSHSTNQSLGLNQIEGSSLPNLKQVKQIYSSLKRTGHREYHALRGSTEHGEHSRSKTH